VTGLLSIVAVPLLRIRYLSLHDPNRPAVEVVPAEWVAVLSTVRRMKPGQPLTIQQFVKHLAGLGATSAANAMINPAGSPCGADSTNGC
jgi:hypothetical protein